MKNAQREYSVGFTKLIFGKGLVDYLVGPQSRRVPKKYVRINVPHDHGGPLNRLPGKQFVRQGEACF
jgi:hypothetical protein